MATELKPKIEKLEKDFNYRIIKSQEDLKEEIKNCNTKLKNEIREEIVSVLDRRLDDKLDEMKEKQDQLNDKLNTLMKMMEKKMTKDRRKQKDDSDMSCASANNLGSPPHNKTRGNQYQCYVVYPPKAKI